MMLKILGQRSSYPVVDLSPVYEKTVLTCQPRRSQRHGGATSVNPIPEPTPTQDDRNIMHRLSRVEDNPPDETEQLQSSGESMSTGAPRRSQRSHKRSRFMDDEYLSSPSVGRTQVNDDGKEMEQGRNLGNEPAAKKRSLKSLSSTETGAKYSPTTTAIHSTSPAQTGVGRAVTRKSLGPVVRYPVGTRLNVKYGAGNPQIYEAKVIDVDIGPEVPRYRVHYRGWNKSHDSWITKIDVVSVIEKPSFPAATTNEEIAKTSSDTTHKISTEVLLVDCKLSSGRQRGTGRDSKTKDTETESQRKKRKQDEDGEEDAGSGGRREERRTRSGRKRKSYGHLGREGSVSSSEESNGESKGEGRSVESVAEVGAVVLMEKDAEDGVMGESGTEEEKDGERGAEEENGEDNGENDAEDRESGLENGFEDGENAEEDGENAEKEGENGSEDVENAEEEGENAEDNGERDERGDEDNRHEDEEEDDVKVEKDEDEEEDITEDHSSDSNDRSMAESRLLIPQIQEIETLQDASLILSLNMDHRSSVDQMPTLIDESILTSESSCESDGMEPVFGCDVKATDHDFIDTEIPNDDVSVSVSNSNSEDACIELMPIETDSVNSGGTDSIRNGGNDSVRSDATDSVRSGVASSIVSDRHCRPDSGSGDTTPSCRLSQLYNAESTRHFAKLRSSPAYTTNFIDLESELKGLDETEKEDYILRKMRKIQIEYKNISSTYNKLTRRCNRASNRKKSHSCHHGSVNIATADTEASPVC